MADVILMVSFPAYCLTFTDANNILVIKYVANLGMNALVKHDQDAISDVMALGRSGSGNLMWKS